MSRIGESILALKQERGLVARKLASLDRLIDGFEVFNQLQPRRRRANGAGVKRHSAKRSAKPRSKPGKPKKAPAGNLAAATE